MSEAKELTEGALDAVNALFDAGRTVFQTMLLEAMEPASAAMLLKHVTDNGWKVRMILEEATCILQLHRGDQGIRDCQDPGQ